MIWLSHDRKQRRREKGWIRYMANLHRLQQKIRLSISGAHPYIKLLVFWSSGFIPG